MTAATPLSNIPAITNTLGLVSTMLGAVLIAVDVTRQYQGKKFDITAGVPRTDYMGSVGTPVVSGQKTYETPEYKAWQRTNFILMRWGLSLLILGGFLQIAATWRFSWFLF